jgi:hypothetical protein
MIDRGPWTVTCRDVAGRSRSLQVVVRGSQVVVVAPPGEAAALDGVEAEQFRAVVATASEVAAMPAPGGSGRYAETGTANTVNRYGDGRVPAAAGHAVSPSDRGGTTTPIPGSAAIPVLRGGLA